MRFSSILLTLLLGPTAALAAPKVATDIAPVHGLVSRVMQGVDTPSRVVPDRASVHSYDLRPSEAAALEDAEIVFWVGGDLTPWLERPIEALASEAVVVSLLETEATQRLGFRETHDHEHDDDHDHGEDAVDPHAWLDPANASRWLDTIAETLADADPENAETYRANAKAGRSEIEAAAKAAGDRLGPAAGIAYLVFHDAYQYFEARYGLTPAAAVTLGDAAQPGPAHIAELQEVLRETGVTCFLVEPQEASALVDSLAGENDLRIVRIDPLGVELEEGPDLYPRLIEGLAASFEACR